MKLSNLFLIATLALIGSPAFAHGDKIVDSTAVTFDAGAATLSATEIQKLRTLVMDAKSKGKVAKVEVAVWSDKEFPATGDLPKADRDLAGRRSDTVKNILRDELGQTKFITTFNMADSANWLSRTFRTNEAELDAVFAKKDESLPMRKDFDIIKRDGAASKAVVVLKTKPTDKM